MEFNLVTNEMPDAPEWERVASVKAELSDLVYTIETIIYAAAYLKLNTANLTAVLWLIDKTWAEWKEKEQALLEVAFPSESDEGK